MGLQSDGNEHKILLDFFVIYFFQFKGEMNMNHQEMFQILNAASSLSRNYINSFDGSYTF